MRKILFALVMFGCALIANAQTYYPETSVRVYFWTHIIPPAQGTGSFPKSPVHPPVVYLDAHTLYICSEHSGYTLTVTDADETEVFSTYIPENTYSVVLPSALSGEYTIELSNDTFVFAGEIEL